MVGTSGRIVSFGSFLILLLGLAGIGVSIYLLVDSFNWSVIVSNFQSVLIVIFIVVSILVFISGIFGLCGGCNGNRCCLGVFLTMVVLWMLVFLVVGILAFVFPKVVLSRGCNASITNIQGIKDRSQLASRVLCQNSCQCYYQSPKQLFLNTNNNPSSPVEVTACPGWQLSYYDGINQELEKRFGCSGWCTGTQGNYFKFTNVNNGPPNGACFDAFYSWFNRYGVIIGAISFAVFGILFIMIFITKCAMEEVYNIQMMRKGIYSPQYA